MNSETKRFIAFGTTCVAGAIFIDCNLAATGVALAALGGLAFFLNLVAAACRWIK